MLQLIILRINHLQMSDRETDENCRHEDWLEAFRNKLKTARETAHTEYLRKLAIKKEQAAERPSGVLQDPASSDSETEPAPARVPPRMSLSKVSESSPFAPLDIPFTGEEKGLCNMDHSATALDYFLLYFHDHRMQLLVTDTKQICITVSRGQQRQNKTSFTSA